MLTAMVLSAGESSRMGSPKALLRDSDDRPFVARVVRTLLSAGLTDVLVVTGAQHDLIEFTLLKAYLNTDRPEEAQRLLSARRPGASGVPVMGVAAVH